VVFATLLIVTTMKLKLTRAVFRNVMEMADVMKANAFVVLELPTGERLWTGSGSLRDEFLNRGRILNYDEKELDPNANIVDAETDDEEDIDGEVAKGPVDDSKEATPRRESTEKSTAKVNGVAEKKRKVDEVNGESPKKRKSLKAGDGDSPSERQAQKEKLNEDQNRESADLFTMMKVRSNLTWFGKDLLHWEKVVADIRQRAVSRHAEWHNAHPVIANPDWHLISHIRYKSSSAELVTQRTTAFGFWANLKSRRVCTNCLCIGGSYCKTNEGKWVMSPKHTENVCKKLCCGQKRCRFCAHAHEHGTPCECPCWTDSLKVLKIIPGRLSKSSRVPKEKVKEKEADADAEPEPEPPAAVVEVVEVEDKGESSQDEPIVEEPTAEETTADESAFDDSMRADEDPAPQTNGGTHDDDDDDDDGHASVWRWNEKDLAENLQIVSEIIIREAQEDHQPLHDLSAHLALWMENAAAGRYSNFYSHILVNSFCQGCCCFLETSENKSNTHTIAECQDRCCGQFLCKFCLHKHDLDDICDCDCVNIAIRALGLEMHDAKKVQESTLAKWEKMEKGKAMTFKREVIEQQRNDEISDW